MAESIKGLNVVIGSETTGLAKALGTVSQKSRDVQAELRQVERLLKFNPHDTVLLAQKQELLAEGVENTTKKLKQLRDVQDQVADQFARGDITKGQYRAFQREIAYTERELAQLESQGRQTKRSLDDIGHSAQNAGTKLKDMGSKLSVASAAITGAAIGAAEGTREFRRDLSRLEVNANQAGVELQKTEEVMKAVNAITGEMDSSIEGVSNLLAAGFKEDNITPAMEALTGAAIKWSDTLKFEGLADGLQETLATGEAIGPFAELLDRSSINLDEFNAGLAEAIANGREQEYVLEVLAQTGLTGVYDEYVKNNQALIDNANATFDFQKAMGELGDTINPILTRIIEKVTGLVEWFNDLPPSVQDSILTIAGIGVTVGPALVIIGNLTEAVGTLILKGKDLSGVFKLLSTGKSAGSIGGMGASLLGLAGPAGPILGCVAAVGALALAWAIFGDDVGRIIGDFNDDVTEMLENMKKAGRTNLGRETGVTWGESTRVEWKPASEEAWRKLKGYAGGGVITKPTLLSDLVSGIPYGIMAEQGPETIVPQRGGVVEHVHSGTVIHRGVNDAGQLVAVVKQEFVRDISNGGRCIPTRPSLIPI